MRHFLASVISCTEVVPDTYLLWIESLSMPSDARPGQFVTVRCGKSVLLRRPFSVHGMDGNRMSLLFTKVGPGTAWLSRRKPGDVLDVLGPLGNGFEIHDSSHHLLLVAGGIGIAPLAHLANTAVDNGLSVKLIHGVRTASQLYNGICKGELIQVTEDGSAGVKGIATDFLPDFYEWAAEVFACGPIPMYRTMANLAGELGQKPCQVLLEQAMGCGLGACRGCTISTKNGMKAVCTDGPVFDLWQIVWERVPEPVSRQFTGSVS